MVIEDINSCIHRSSSSKDLVWYNSKLAPLTNSIEKKSPVAFEGRRIANTLLTDIVNQHNISP